MSTSCAPQPASSTKHLSLLHHPIPHSPVTLSLRQISSTAGESTGTTGSTLWLSAQLLALYILSLPTPSSSKKVTVLDLGSGIGFLPLCLRSKGYDVIATDIPEVIESVLGPNVDEGLKHLEQSGGIEVIPLNWETVSSSGELPVSLKGKKIDIITTTDTLYAPHLLEPLLITLRLLSTGPTQPMIYVGLERRDPGLIDGALEKARDMGLSLNRIDKGKIDRLMEDDGWEIGEWDDVEIWKGKFTRSSIKAHTT